MRFRVDRVEGILSRRWYGRPTLEVARDLLGKVLIVRADPSRPLDDGRAGLTAGRIIETEAYHGSDPASHCSRGRTPRCSVMFGPPGVAYVYFVYGMHEMLNFVTERDGYPGAVLIRAVEPLLGQELMARRRAGLAPLYWTSGPGRLCQAMGIRLSHQGQELTGPCLFVADDGWRPRSVLVSPRVGIRAGVRRPWRFFVADNPYVSRVSENLNARPDRRRPAWRGCRPRSR